MLKSKYIKLVLCFWGLFFGGGAMAQTDLEFWFSVPEINRYHQSGNDSYPCNDGTPTRFRITTLNSPANVKISMPANSNFNGGSPITLSIPANTTYKLELAPYISDYKVDEYSSMENRLLWVSSNLSGSTPYINRNNKGIHIESDSYITVYYEIGAINNKELLTLKGKNALGKLFYVPFQTEYEISDGYNYKRRPYSSFDIVATQNNTHVKITVPKSIFVRNNNGSNTYLNAGTHDLWLNQGETAIIAPYAYRYSGYQTSFVNKLAGSKVEVVEGGDVAVITKEDMALSPGSVDYIADQLVPVGLTGTAYAVIKGYALNNNYNRSYEHFYVVGTENGTTVNVKFSDGTASSFTIDEMGSKGVSIPYSADVAIVESDKPVYVFHQSGVGTQFAGAIVPTISVCTGSSSVAFNRTMAKNNYQACPCGTNYSIKTNFNFYLNVLVYKGAEDGFKLYKGGVDVTGSEWGSPTFYDLPDFGVADSPFSKYRYARIEVDDIDANTAYTLVNTKNVFHLGVINGAGIGVTSENADAFYGYFSDFSKVEATGFVGGIVENSKRICKGQTTTLVASGGTNFHWYRLDDEEKVVFPSYLDDSLVANPNTLPTLPVFIHRFNVVVSGACDLTDTAQVTVKVGELICPGIKVDKDFVCGPDAEFIFEDTTQKAKVLRWYIKEEGSSIPDPGVLQKVYNNNKEFRLTVSNNDNAIKNYDVTRIAIDATQRCMHEQKITVGLCDIKYSASRTLADINGCHPLTVNFKSTYNSGYNGGVTYEWDFGDGATSSEANPTHIYENYTDAPVRYEPKLTVINDQGCSHDTLVLKFTVQPYIHANFAIDTSAGCSVFTQMVENNSKGGIASYIWDKDGSGFTTAVIGNTPDNWVYTKTNNTDLPITETIGLKIFTANGACSDVYTQDIITYPTPKATITINPLSDTKCSPFRVKLTGTVIGPATNYRWEESVNSGAWVTIGNTVDIAEYVINNYGATSNTHRFRLAVTGDHGCYSYSDVKSVQVYPFIDANFVIDTAICAPGEVLAQIRKYPGATNYSFDWGDGSLYNVTNPPDTIRHTYNNVTDATIIRAATLTVTNIAGCKATKTQKVYVYPQVVSVFTASPDEGCAPLDVNFTNSSKYVNNTLLGDKAQYTWNFGDGTSSLLKTPTTHTFNNSTSTSAAYAVELIATSKEGCTNSSTSNVTVQPFVDAVFSVDSSKGCSPITVNFSYETYAGITQYIFNWGDGSSVQTFDAANATGSVQHQFINKTNGVLVRTVKLTVRNAYCERNMELPITVYPEVQSAFTPLTTTVCAPLPVTFTNGSHYLDGTLLSNATYYWNFGEGTSSIEAAPTHTFSNLGVADSTYTVRLTARSGYGCSSVSTGTVKVHPFIAAQFAIDTCYGCSPVDILFRYNTHNSVTKYTWTWGDGTSTEILKANANGKIKHTYTNTTGSPEVRTVKLVIENGDGCTDEMEMQITIYPQITASFNMDKTTGCSPLTVAFTNSSVYEGGTQMSASDNATYYWDFGDGTTSIGFSPTHTFRNVSGSDATYTITLSIRTQTGCTSVATGQVTVNSFVESKLAIDVSSGCSPLDVAFSYTKYTGVTSYVFTWDDGTAPTSFSAATATGTTNHTFNNTTGAVATYDVTLNISNGAGCSDQATVQVTSYPEVKAAFTPSTTKGCNALSVNFDNQSVFSGTTNSLTNTLYYWTFGDGTSSEVAEPTHLFENADVNNNVIYTTKLKAVSQYGCADSIAKTIEVYNRVESHFSFVYDSHCTPFNITFKPAALGASTFNWSYGGAPNLPNETFTNNNSFTRQFTNLDKNNVARYDVTLDVANDEGCHASETRVVEVDPIVTASITPSVLAGCSNLDVTFTNASTGGSLESIWNFGNGQSASNSNGASVSHTYTNRGSIDSVYTVSLLVTNANGCSNKTTTKITVYPKVESNFVFAQQSKCTPFYLDLTNTSLNGNTFSWDFGYGGLDTLVYSKKTFPYIFDNPTDNDILTYTITLTTSDSRTGCKDVSAKEVTVYPRVITRFKADVVEGCNPLMVNYKNTSTGLGTYLWKFGDGSTSDLHTPAQHTYSHAYIDRTVIFNASLTTTNIFGCSSKKDTVITVYPLVKSDFQWDKIEGCTPLTINLNNSSVSAQYSYQWNFDDGTDTTIAQPRSHTYINASKTPPVVEPHVISLAVSYKKNGITCSDTMFRQINVFPHIYPEFTASFSGCHPHAEQFTNSTVAFSSNTNYSWNLGNGLFSIEKNPALIYYNTSKTVDSTFTVKLVATSEHGCTDSVNHVVTVHPRPYAAMELVGEYISCPQFDVEIDNNSIGTDLTNHYRFGDGSDSITTSMANMTHLFGNTGSETVPYVIQLNVESVFGCDDSVTQTIYVYPEVTASYSVDPGYSACSPFTVSFNSNLSKNAKFYQWNFDDGVTSSYSAPTHLFLNPDENDKLFDVTLYASSEFGCFDIDTQQILVYATPIANIAVEPPLKKFPDAKFNIYNQSSPAADSWSYSWDFGDSQYSTLKYPGTHTYLSWAPKNNSYKYNVSLKIESPHCLDEITTSIFLLPADPIAEFYSEIDSSCSPLEINLINVSEYGETYFWEFGDGTTSTEREPSHTFVNPGYYNVKLTVSGDGGIRFYYSIFRVYQNPTANFIVSPSHVMLPDATIKAFNLSKDYTRSLWEFGDGEISNDQNPIHTYSKMGEYRISLWTYMDYGNDVCVDSISQSPAAWVEGKGILKFPNAFKPNQDGPNGGVYDAVDYKNQVFHPYHYGVTDYKLIIMSRWGELLFTSNDVNVGWDGYVNGKLADQAVYVWRAVGRFTNDKPFDMKGTVTLIR